MKKTNLITKVVKKAAEKQIRDATDQRCIFLCYQPTIPKSIIEKKSKSLK